MLLYMLYLDNSTLFSIIYLGTAYLKPAPDFGTDTWWRSLLTWLTITSHLLLISSWLLTICRRSTTVTLWGLTHRRGSILGSRRLTKLSLRCTVLTRRWLLTILTRRWLLTILSLWRTVSLLLAWLLTTI